MATTETREVVLLNEAMQGKCLLIVWRVDPLVSSSSVIRPLLGNARNSRKTVFFCAVRSGTIAT
jgi:hypothetical protein